MQSEKGVSIIAVVITIIVIILLSTIVGVSSKNILQKSEESIIKQELRNVEELVESKKAKIMGDLIAIPDTYVATDQQIDSYSFVLSEEEIAKIKEINNDDDIPTSGKYHIMDQGAFDDVFKNDVNVKDVTRKYLINFEQEVVVLKLDRKVYKTGEIL